jgi:hypothetical protein
MCWFVSVRLIVKRVKRTSFLHAGMHVMEVGPQAQHGAGREVETLKPPLKFSIARSLSISKYFFDGSSI